MVRTRGRDGRIVRCEQLRRGVSTLMHGELAIDLGNIPYSGILPPSDPGSPYISSHSSTPFSNPSSSIPLSSGHGEFRHAYPHPTVSPHHTHISSSSHPLSIPVPPGPSFSVPTYHQSVPTPLHQTWSFPLQLTPGTFVQPTNGTFVQATPSTFVQTTLGTFVQTTPYPIVHTTSSPSILTTVGFVQGLSDHVDHGATVASVHDLPPEEVQRDPTGRC